MGIRFKLAEILEEYQINQYQLSRAADVRPNTIGDMCKNKSRRIEIVTLEKILFALNQLTNRSISLADLMEYVPDETKKTGD